MKISGTSFTSIWYEEATDRILYIDQTRLPWELAVREMKTFEDGIRAIADMEVRGAPLIGVAAAFALYAGVREKGGSLSRITEMGTRLVATRPTAVNLAYAVKEILNIAESENPVDFSNYPSLLLKKAIEIRESEYNCSRLIGEHGIKLIREVADHKDGRTVNILTHCNAGWLATVDYGTALAPIYLAHDSGIPVHVWVDETRPRNQGAKLTVYELTQHGVPNTLIVDNAGGLLMQQGKVDLVIIGADRITANGDAVNKIGTYLKALAAFDNQVPFYVAAPASTFDSTTATGAAVVIEERGDEEVLFINNQLSPIAPAGTRVHNPGFDITPSRLITAYITESGVS
jgi:methylthioribose-1-phosphate isomerase